MPDDLPGPPGSGDREDQPRGDRPTQPLSGGPPAPPPPRRPPPRAPERRPPALRATHHARAADPPATRPGLRSTRLWAAAPRLRPAAPRGAAPLRAAALRR